MHIAPRLCLSVVCLSLLASVLAAADFVWWEGEAASETNFTNTAFAVTQYGDKAKGLSGGDWLNTQVKQGEKAFAVWQVQVPQDATYNFLVRKFWKHGPFTWTWDGKQGGTCGPDCGLLDGYDLAKFIGANWVSLGTATLTKGAHTLRVDIDTSGKDGAAACFDCFVLSVPPFSPRGKLKPGERYGTHDEGWWAFEPQTDAFVQEKGQQALLDLRSLNEVEAGISGTLRAEGDHFVLGNGKPVRFWSVNTNVPELGHAELDYFAARLAKVGVNLVRIHGGVFDREGADPMAVNMKRVDNVAYLVHALKKQGIYTLRSVFYPLWMEIKSSDGIPGYEALTNKHPFGLLYFDPRMQELYKSWISQELAYKSPYSGKTLAEESALGIFEIINEDSLFFWTFKKEQVGATQWRDLEHRYGAWLAKAYGSLDKAFAAWPTATDGDDLLAEGRAGLLIPWDLTGGGIKDGDHRKRATDQACFYAQLQHDFYAGMRDYLRSLGVKCPISASNWTTADNALLGGLERWSYTATDVIDKHGYFGGKHEGPRAGYMVNPGDTYEDKSALLDPASVPIAYMQIHGRPQIHSELGWNKPNRFIADFSFLTSAYASLQGIDSFILFATGSGSWESGGAGKWTLMMPGELGQFPAEALQFRRGDLTQGETVVRQVVSTNDLFALKGIGQAEGVNADFSASDAAKAFDPTQRNALDPLSYFVGRVERVITGLPTNANAAAPAKKEAKNDEAPLAVDLKTFINRDAKTIASSTGQIHWDYGKGLATVNSPKSQGATGFLKQAGVIALADVTIASENEYGTVHVIALDDAPLATAKTILVQAFSEEKMYGFRSSNGKIEDIGQAPITVRDIGGTVTLRIKGKPSATILDEHGYARGDAKIEGSAGAWVLTLPKDALYTVVKR